MPVWWSPSSKTALAEAELEYNQSHQSQAVYVRFRILEQSLPESLHSHCQHSRGVYGLVWTTTGWSMVRECNMNSDKSSYFRVKLKRIKFGL